MSFRHYLLLILLTGAWPGVAGARSEESIAISATARPDYVRPTDAQGRPKGETYVFTQGQFLGGDSRDRRLERTAFSDIVGTLARSLAQQNYFPEHDAGAAGLCIVVHWGTTTVYSNPLGQFGVAAMNNQMANASADPGLTNLLEMEREGHRDLAAAAIDDNAVLLGYAATLEKERVHASPSPFERDLVDELNEKRYFVVLMAYDLAFLRTEHRPKLLWVTRLSMRSPGNNFTEALPALSEAGGRVFGQQLDGLAHVKGSWQRGQVVLHELEVLGVEGKDTAPVKSGK